MASLKLPIASRRLEAYRTGGQSPFPAAAQGPFNRRAFAAVHVVADPLSEKDPWLDPAIDWDATIAYRQHLWRLGFAVAEAMDTAQRGMGLDWPTSLELIGRSVAAAAEVPGAIVFSGGAPITWRPARASASTTWSAPTRNNARRSKNSAAVSC